MKEPTHFAAVFGVFMCKEETLLARRCNTGHMDGKYGLVSGHVELGESCIDALIREIHEEAGVVVTPEDMTYVHTFTYRSVDRDYMNIVFRIDKWSGEIHNQEPEKCDDLAWFPQEDLPHNTIPYIRQVLQCVHQNKQYSEYVALKNTTT